ncbi:hypothetical protein AB0K18_42975 [Nonomuraea sp. NPDC049421]|uniref:hypothetical protein n=1 Tax=Nonomuraea sp. NPDC049421 TaxID=3155275 RepID=UPI00343A2626
MPDLATTYRITANAIQDGLRGRGIHFPVAAVYKGDPGIMYVPAAYAAARTSAARLRDGQHRAQAMQLLITARHACDATLLTRGEAEEFRLFAAYRFAARALSWFLVIYPDSPMSIQHDIYSDLIR